MCGGTEAERALYRSRKIFLKFEAGSRALLCVLIFVACCISAYLLTEKADDDGWENSNPTKSIGPEHSTIFSHCKRDVALENSVCVQDQAVTESNTQTNAMPWDLFW